MKQSTLLLLRFELLFASIADAIKVPVGGQLVLSLLDAVLDVYVADAKLFAQGDISSRIKV
jgi:hypothetical protein